MEIKKSFNSRSIALSCCRILTAVLCSSLGASESNELETLYLNSFDTDSPDLGWYVQNDNVMGGKSEGGFNISSGQLIFSGNTNTDGGGFSSTRSKPLNLDLSAYDGIRVKVAERDFFCPLLGKRIKVSLCHGASKKKSR